MTGSAARAYAASAGDSYSQWGNGGWPSGIPPAGGVCGWSIRQHAALHTVVCPKSSSTPCHRSCPSKIWMSHSIAIANLDSMRVPTRARSATGSSTVGPSRSTSANALSTASSVYLYVSDADALHAEWAALEDLAGRLIAPHDTPYGLREFVYIDPDGTQHRIGSRGI
jgi:hypothetical protein